MTTPAELLAGLLRDDAAAPRITCYDDAPGPTRGERIELSARVLGNWVAKAANLLQEEHDLEPGDVVRLELAPHWRALYWALAVWEVGGAVAVDGAAEGAGEVLLVTDDPERLVPGPPAVLVSRGALARSAGAPVPEGVLDEAAELPTFGDSFTPWAEPDPTDPALVTPSTTLSHGDVVAAATAALGADLPPAARVQLVTPDLPGLLLGALAAWSVGGSLLVHVGAPDPDAVARRAADEGVTVLARP